MFWEEHDPWYAFSAAINQYISFFYYSALTILFHIEQKLQNSGSGLACQKNPQWCSSIWFGSESVFFIAGSRDLKKLCVTDVTTDSNMAASLCEEGSLISL